MEFVNGMAQLAHSVPFGILVVLDFFLVATSAGLVLISALSGAFGWDRFKGLAKPSAYLALASVLAGPIALLADLGHPLRFLNLFWHFNARSAMSWGSYILMVYTISLGIYVWLLNQNLSKAKNWGILSAVTGVALATYTGMLLAEANSRFLWNSALTPVLFILSGWVSAWGVLAMCSQWFPGVTRLKGVVLEKHYRSILLSLLFIEIILVLSQLLVLATNGTQGMAMLNYLFSNRQFTFLWVQILLGMLFPAVILCVRPGAVAVSGSLAVIGVFFIRYNMIMAGQEIPLTGRVFGYTEHEPLMWVIFFIALMVVGFLITVIPKAMEFFAKKSSGEGKSANLLP